MTRSIFPCFAIEDGYLKTFWLTLSFGGVFFIALRDGEGFLLQNTLSKAVAYAAIRVALSMSRDEESDLKTEFAKDGVIAAGADYGGEFVTSIRRIVERA